jgi:hypothetical protein
MLCKAFWHSFYHFMCSLSRCSSQELCGAKGVALSVPSRSAGRFPPQVGGGSVSFYAA